LDHKPPVDDSYIPFFNVADNQAKKRRLQKSFSKEESLSPRALKLVPVQSDIDLVGRRGSGVAAVKFDRAWCFRQSAIEPSEQALRRPTRVAGWIRPNLPGALSDAPDGTRLSHYCPLLASGLSPRLDSTKTKQTHPTAIPPGQ
jgi:hypothetical protein